MPALFRIPAALALAACLLASSLASAADRPAEEILADYRAITYPKSDPAKKDPDSVRAFRASYSRADARKAELAMELFRTNPGHAEVPKLMHDRWVNTMMDPATAAATIDEIDRALPYFKDAEVVEESRFMQAIATINSHRETPELAMPAIDEFIRQYPRGSRPATLLGGFAASIKDVRLRARLLKRLIADYPDSPSSRSAVATLALIENLGKPIDLEFTDAIGGRFVSIKQLKGKVVVLDFWATWCGPCVAEMPRMKKLYAEFKGRGVEFIGVSLDAPKEEGGLDKLKSFVAKNEITWPQYYQGDGFDGEFTTRMGVNMVPQLFLIDTNGNLASIDAQDKLDLLIPELLEKAKAGPKAR